MAKIAFWTASHLPDLGGFQWSTYRLAKALAKLGHQPTFVTRQGSNQEFATEIPVIRLGGDSILEWTQVSGKWLKNHRNHFDLIHTIDCFYKAIDEQLDVLSSIGLPTIMKIPTQGCVKRLINTADRQKNFREINAFSALNPMIVSELRQLSIDIARIHQIPNGVDSSEFVPATNCAELRKKLGLPENKILLLFMGRLVCRKRLDVLLSAAELMLPTITLVIVGSAFEQRDSFEEEIVKRASTLPNVILRPPTAEVLPYYQACDIHVLLSEREGLPNSVLEGMSCALPTVVSNIPGMVEVVDSELNGVVVPVGDISATVATFTRLATDTKFRKRLGQAARRKIVAQYDIQIVALAYNALYKVLLTQKGNGP